MLEKYRVLDLSRLLPGPFASHLLADMGMDIVKIEETAPRYGMGRDTLTPPDPTPEEEERWAAHNAVARNKRSVALDLLDSRKRPRSQEVFYRLVEKADVILEGYRPGVVTWMGIDYEKVKAYNPRIIYCSISGYGQSGPYTKLPGHDPQYCSVAGSVGPTVDANGDPRGHGTPLADISSAIYAAMAILAALLEREHSGEGRRIDVPMVGAALSFMTMSAANMLRQGSAPASPTTSSSLTFMRCKDGKYISTSNSETIFWENFCHVIDREQYIPLRVAVGPERHRMIEDIRNVIGTKDRGEWLSILREAETCVAPVNDISEALDDPQIRHLGLLWSVNHPTQGTVQQVGFPVLFSSDPARFRGFAPLLGEHTRDLLREAGFATAAIDELEKAGVVKSQKRTPSSSTT